MSKSKKSISLSDIRNDARLSSGGSEVLSSSTRVVNAYLPTMGERIRRYSGQPLLQSDIYNHPDYWSEEDQEEMFDENGDVRYSVHEERYQEGLKVAKAKKVERDAAEKQALKEQKDAEAAYFRDRVRQALIDGDTTASQAPPEASE